MPSTYTVNLGIEKPATGEQSGTWGDTTNVNFDIIDQAVNGSVRVTLTSAGTSGSPNDLNIVNGSTTSSEGRNKWIEIYSASDLGGSAYVRLVPNDAEKILFIRNSLAGSQSVLLFQGTYNASNDLEIPAGVDMVVKFDGAGASATVTDVFTKLRATEITTPTLTAGTADINGGSVDGATVGAASASTGAFTTLTASTSLNIASSTTVDGVLDEDNMASDSATKLATQQSIKAYVDSQVGTVDTWAEVLANGATSGATNPEIDSGQALKTNTINETTAGSGVTIDSVLLKDDVVNATDIETSNISANDGTAAATIANSTGNFTITNFISNSVDIGGGAIDGTNIGASTAGTGAFTTLGASGVTTLSADLAVNTDTLFVDVSDDVTIAGYTEAPYSLNYGYGQFAVVSSNTYSGMSISAHSDAAINGSYFGFTRSRGTLASPSYVQAGDLIGTATAQPYRLSGGSNRYSDSASMSFVASQTHSATQNGTDITFKSAEDGTITLYERLSLESDLTVFNEDSRDVDFRVESDSNANMLFVDAGNNRIGMGTNSGTGSLHIKDVKDSGGADVTVIAQNTTSNRIASYQILDESNNVTTKIQYDNGGNRGALNIQVPTLGNADVGFDGTTFLIASNSSSAALVLQSNSTDRFKLKATGEGVFNNSSNDYDFRVESNSSTHALFVDATNGNIGINDSAPSSTLASGVSATGRVLSIASGGTTAISIRATDSVNDRNAVLEMLSSGNGGSNNIIVYGDTDTTPSSKSGLIFQGYHNGSRAQRAELDWSGQWINEIGAIFNDSGADSDFRVESDSNTHALFVDASENLVTVGSSGGYGTLQVVGDNAPTEYRTLFVTSASDITKGVAIAYDYANDYGVITAVDAGTGWRPLIVKNTSLNVDQSLVANDSGGDNDFRVESDSNTHMLFVDAGNNTVSVGGSTSLGTLSVISTVDGTEAAPHFAILGAASNYQLNMWLDATAAYIGQNSALRSLRLYSSAETAGVQLSAGATSWSTFSDERLKENVEPFENALQSLSGLRTVKYHLKDVDGPEDKKKIGVIAQDLVGVLDEVIDPTFRPDDDTEYMGVRYTELVPVLIKAIQEQQDLIESLTARVAQLETN